MPPSNFQEARAAASATSQSGGGAPPTLYYCAQVDGRPYLPNLRVPVDVSASCTGTSSSVDIDDLNLSVATAAVTVLVAAVQNSDNVAVSISPTTNDELKSKLTVKVVSGGITNSLYRVSGLRELDVFAKKEEEDGEENRIDESVLVRVFGEFYTDKQQSVFYFHFCTCMYIYVQCVNNGRSFMKTNANA